MAKRILAMTLVICMLVSALPLQALAADGDGTFTDGPNTETVDGLTVTTTTTTTQTTDSTSGNVTVTVEIQKDTNGTDANGVTIDRSETTTTTTVEGADGSTSEKVVTNGDETKEWTGAGVSGIPGAEDVLPSVEVQLVPGGKSDPATVTGTVTDTVGDEKEGDGDLNYDYTDIVIDVDRTVTAESSDITVTVDKFETDMECPVKPEDYDGKHKDNANMTDPQAGGLGVNVYHDMVSNPQENPPEDGYDFFFSGNGDWTDAAVPVFKYIVYERYEEGDEIPEGSQIGDIVYDDNGNPIPDEEKSYLIDPGPLYGNTGMKYQPAQLELKNGEDFFYAYCADYLVEVSQEAGHRYKIENLEDSGHYTEEDAAKLRAIVENAYWGTEKGTGSLAEIKTALENYAVSNPTVVVQDKNGKDVSFDLASLLGDMKEHEALAVTQAAIWAYSINRTNTAYEAGKLPKGVDSVIVTGAQSAIKAYEVVEDKGGNPVLDENGNPTFRTWLLSYTPAKDQSNASFAYDGKFVTVSEEEKARREEEALRSDARMKALFDYLMNLDGVTPDDPDANVTTLLNEKNNIEDVSLVVHDLVANHTDNNDGNNNNDVYNTDLQFTLAFVPDDTTDDLLVYLYDSKGELIEDPVTHEPIVRRLAGTNSEGREAEDIQVDEINGERVYTLTGLQLSENSDFTFDLRLEGTQYLNEGVYLYTANGGRLASQTFVGLAAGTQTVDLSASMTISFDVDENNHVIAERHWHTDPEAEKTPPTPPKNPPKTPTNPPVEPRTWNAPQVNRLANNDVVINEEPVPLASPAITGDSTGLWVALFLTVAFAMVAVNLFDKKRQHEAF